MSLANKTVPKTEHDQLVDYLEGEEPDDLGLTEADLPTKEEWQAEIHMQRMEDQ